MDASQSRRARREADRQRKRRMHELEEAVRWVAADPRGRLFLYHVIHRICRRDETCTIGTNGEATQYRSAVRDVALQITNLLDTVCPELRVELEVESVRRNHARRADAEHVRRVAAEDDSGIDD